MGIDYFLVSPKHEKVLEIGRFRSDLVRWGNGYSFNIELPLNGLTRVNKIDASCIELGQLKMADQYTKYPHEEKVSWADPETILAGTDYPWKEIKHWYESVKDDPQIFIIDDCSLDLWFREYYVNKIKSNWTVQTVWRNDPKYVLKGTV